MHQHVRFLFIFFSIFGFIYFLLRSFLSSDFILKTALFILAFHIVDFFIKIVWNSLPSLIIPDVTEKAVFITGCDTGFGNKLARQLDRKGITVYAGCLFSEGEGASQLKKDCSKKLHIVQIDVTKHDQVSAAVKYVTSSLNDKSFENIPFAAAYAMSKHAVLAYATTIRRELLRWSVSVHTIEPRIYNTEMKNKSIILSKLDRGFIHAPEETREEYGGDEYVKAYTNAYDISDCLQCNRIEEVTDCMMDAIIAKYPKPRYQPGLIGRIHFWLATYILEDISDMFYFLFIHLLIGNIHDAGKKNKSFH
ncbi:hypothetical protein L9F63_017377 [Diploptera punctata]|uniref:Uncharacterized protein n=1 Tax=Diploptera punctata TaxID=6984 RepID=A0AAD7ZZ29_DIPPU|nr:hypothetical protein L9F63_017377 [Diploptera punctata]